MKIRKLNFHNINNLKGSHEIDFNGLPLKTAGIFAITGPTGAGKSTLLDVITLALFNRIPRFKKAISKGEMQGLGSILTHHTTEASATIEYEIKGQVYVSSWNVSKARTGTLKDYEMALMDSTGTYLDLKRSEVPAKNEEIIGLKYDQFIKSIILSQGEFSKFLKADKNERGQLLENLTGTSIYRKIGTQAFQKFKEVNESAKLGKALLEDIKVLTAEERAEIETAINTAKTELHSVDGKLTQQDTLIQAKRELQTVQRELAQNTEEKDRLSQQLAGIQGQTDRLRLHEKLSPAASDLGLYGKVAKEIRESQKQSALKKEQLTDAEQKLKNTLDQIQVLTGSEVTAEGFIEQINSFEQEVLELDRQKAESRQKGIDQRLRINQLKVASELVLGDKIGPDEALDLITAYSSSLNQSLKKATLDKTADVKEVKVRLRSNRESVELLKTVFQNLQLIDQVSKEVQLQRQQLTVQEKELDRLIPLTEKSSLLLNELKEKETLLLQQKEDALKIASLEELRSDLTDDKPCPLCGATDHPFSAHSPEDIRPELDVKLKGTRQNLRSEEEDLKKLTASLTQAETKKSTTEVALTEANKKLEQHTVSQTKLATEYTGQETLTTAALENRLPLLLAENAQLEEAITALEQLRVNEELSQAFTDFKRITSEYKSIDKQRKDTFSGTDVVARCKGLRDQFAQVHTSITAAKSALSFEENRLAQSKVQLVTLEAQLSPMLTTHGFNSIEEMSANLLKEAEAESIRRQRDQLNNRITANQANLESLQNRKAVQSALDSAPDMLLENLISEREITKNKRDTLSMELGGNTEKIRKDNQDKELIAGKAEALDKLNKEVQKWSLLNKMIGDAYGNKFSNFAQGLTLQNLLVYTNRRLIKLSDRYLLDKPTDDGALKVIDQYQGNSERSVSTLSGGETFLLSLALALSLSDMASKNVSLDSLFIDEGFGTLDQETLDIAMTTLERLQSESQKTVGVISHVEALKERINVQIKLEKNAQGYSSIKIE